MIGLAVSVGVLAGCGGGDQTLVVSAAASLQGAFSRYADSFPNADIRQSFAGSDQLAAQIRSGARPDVYAAASTDYPKRLYRAGLVSRPRIFAANRLVVAVPAGSGISSLSDLAKPGTALVIGDRSVPVGSYAREALDRLPSGERAAILANVRSEEPEVSSIVAKLAEGAADAGFVYGTDAEAAGGELRTIRLPESLQPDVAYGVAIVRGAEHQELARRFVGGLLRGAGARDLRAAGFLAPP